MRRRPFGRIKLRWTPPACRLAPSVGFASSALSCTSYDPPGLISPLPASGPPRCRSWPSRSPRSSSQIARQDPLDSIQLPTPHPVLLLCLPNDNKSVRRSCRCLGFRDCLAFAPAERSCRLSLLMSLASVALNFKAMLHFRCSVLDVSRATRGPGGGGPTLPSWRLFPSPAPR